MLENLRIKNIALIEELEISFGERLNILSGETGAGKSIIIDSISFVLGERANKDLIRSGEDSAFVEALFHVDNDETINVLKESGIEIDEDNAILFFRSISASGKSLIRINGRTVTLGMLKQLTPFFVDLHGQHEHQSLLNPQKHIRLVDKFCGQELVQLKERLAEDYKEYREVSKKINEISGDEKERFATLDLLKFQIDEIKRADLSVNEDEELSKRRDIINSSQNLILSTGNALELLYGSDSDRISAIDGIAKAINYVENIVQIDSTKSNIVESLSDISSELEEISSQLRQFYESLEYDPNEIEEIESRLDLIYGLKRKYGSTVEEILEHYEKITQRFDFITNSAEQIEIFDKEKKMIEKDILMICKSMSKLRKVASQTIQNEIIQQLQELGMKNVAFEVQFERRDKFSLDGYDKIEFYISMNIGETPKPLAKTASGGEMSRIMLALKTVLADVDNIETFIFDEIDSGVSGRTAQKVAEKLASLSRKHQILCITHLPQIAAMADNHYLIEKEIDNTRTITNMHELKDDKIIEELARLTAGAMITDMTLKAAKEMKDMAINIKKDLE